MHKKSVDNSHERKCYKCDRKGHLRKDCRRGNSREQGGGALICSLGAGEDPVTAEFIADSGATDHMCHDRGVFINFTSCSVKIETADGDTMEGEGRGTVGVKCFDGHNWICREMMDVVYVPKLKYNLFSVTAGTSGLQMQKCAK